MHPLLHLVVRRSFDGHAWHGPSLAEVLVGVDARTAVARPLPNAHCIWELTHHVTAWTREVARRLRGAAPAMPVEGDWPAPIDATSPDLDARWARLLVALGDARSELVAALDAFPDDRLDDRVHDAPGAAPGTWVTYGEMIIGLAQHDAYHGGQIMLLRRGLQRAAAASPPADPATITES